MPAYTRFELVSYLKNGKNFKYVLPIKLIGHTVIGLILVAYDYIPIFGCGRSI